MSSKGVETSTSSSSSSSSSSSKNKGKKRKHISKSGRSSHFTSFYHGQSEADMAKVRETSRAIAEGLRRDDELLQDLGEDIRDAEENNGETLLTKYMDRVNKNFEGVNRNREFVGDAQNLTIMHDVVLSKVNVASNYTQLKTADVLRHLHIKFSDSTAMADDDDGIGVSSNAVACRSRTDLDWVKLGKGCATLFKAPPITGFVRGAFSTDEFQAKQQKKRKRTSRKQEDPRKRKSIPVMNEDDKEDDPTTKLSNKIHQRLKELQELSGGKKHGMFEVLVDPTSFEKTVENIFAASFLVKDAVIDVQVSDPKDGVKDGIPMISVTDGGAGVSHGASQKMHTQPDENNSGDVENCVVSLNIHDWKKICAAVAPGAGVWEPKIERPDVIPEDDDSEEVDDEESEIDSGGDLSDGYE